MKIAVIYFSKTGKTAEMAEVIASGAREVSGVEVRCFSLENVDACYVKESSCVLLGSPTYLANMAWQMKQWLDELPFKLGGKLGGAFATANYPQGGSEVAVLTLLQHMLAKGMMVYSTGTYLGHPYMHLGPVAFKENFEESKEMFHIFGKRMAQKGMELFGHQR